MSYQNIIHLDFKQISAFLLDAKKKCFAGTDMKVSASDGTSMYSVRELPWLYTDTYCGNTVERGTENVYYDMVLIWSMQYRGGVLRHFWPLAQAVSRFLKHALRNLPEEFPIRGPKLFVLHKFKFNGQLFKGTFIYENAWVGDLEHFTGRETITWNNDLAFYHDYMGGFIRNKYFPATIDGTQQFHA